MTAPRGWFRRFGPLVAALAAAAVATAWAIRVGFEDFEVSQRAEMLRSRDSHIRHGALLELSLLCTVEPKHAQAALPLVLRAIDDRSPLVREQALITLSDLAGNPRALGLDPSVNALARRITMKHLEDPSPQVRGAAIGSLGRLGPVDVAALPALVRMSGASEHLLTRMGAMTQLGRFHYSASTPRHVLLATLDDHDPDLRTSAVQSLGTWVGHDTATAEALVARLDDDVLRVRFAAYEALRQLGNPPTSLLPRLVQLVENDNPVQASVGAELLARIGTPARSAAPALLAAQRRHLPSAWSSTYTVALARVAPDSAEAAVAVAALTHTLADGPLGERVTAARTLGTFGHHARIAVPELRQAAQSNDKRLSAAAAEALRLIEAQRPLPAAVGDASAT